MSYCCIPKKTLIWIGLEPFCVSVSGADDFYLFNVLPLIGSVVFITMPLAAYRITDAAQSDNRIKSLTLALHSFELLQRRYQEVHDKNLYKLFKMVFASKRRHYAKILMTAGMFAGARMQLLSSLKNTCNPVSVVKSLLLLSLSYLPAQLQPSWLPINRGSIPCEQQSTGVEK